jgi:hypothetical protein
MKKIIKEKPFDQKLLAEEMGELCRKYGLTGCVFASEKDGKLIGFHCIEREGSGFNQKHICESAFNAARLFQSAREKMMHMMDGGVL